MSYDPDAIFASANSTGYDPDKIFGSRTPAPEPEYVTQSRDLGMSEDDFAPKIAESEADDSVFGTFKGIADNMGLALNLPVAMIGGALDVVERTVRDAGTAAAALNPFSDVKVEDSELLTGLGDLVTGDVTPREIAASAGQTFSEGTGNRIIAGTSPEAQAVRGAVADAVPREALQVLEALPPSGVAVRAGGAAGRYADDLMGVGGFGASDEAIALAKLEREASGPNAAQIATDAVRSRGERIQDNSDTLSGRSTGSAFMTDEHIEMLENATPQMRERMLRQLEESRQLRNGAGDGTATPYNVVADEFEQRANVLSRMGERFLADRNEARRKITGGEGSDLGDTAVWSSGSPVYTSTRKLRDGLMEELAAVGVTRGENGKLDFTNSPIADGQGKLQKAVERFLAGTSTAKNDGYTVAASFDDLDNLKLYLQRAGYVNSRKNGPGGETNALIQRLSGRVNGALREISPEYAEANDGLASVISSMQDLATATKATNQSGKPINLLEAGFDTESSRRIAQNSRKLTSNYESGINMDQTLKDIDELLIGQAARGDKSKVKLEELDALGIIPDGKGGFEQTVNPRQLALFATYADALNGDAKPTSLRGLLKESDSRHMENLVTNSIWGNMVGATASAWKLGQSTRKSPEKRMKEAGKQLSQDLELKKKLREEVEAALSETLQR
jgi:hypothetical protein